MEFKISAESVTDWLRYIHNAGEPLNWIAQYESNLLSVLQQGLNHERYFRKSFELLSLVFPYFALTLSHNEIWSPLLRDALLMAQDIKDNELQVNVFRWMGEAYLKTGQHESARSAFSTALERAEVGCIDDMIVLGYTGLFKLFWFDLDQIINKKLVDVALATAKQVQDKALQAGLYDALASAYVRLGDTDIALGYGQTAFVYWWSLRDHSGIGRAAYTLSAIYMHIAQLKDNKHFLSYSMSFLDIARDELARTDDVWQYPLLAYEQASIYFQLEEFEEAASWYQQSLSEAERMDSPHYTLIAQHGLGLSQSKLAQFHSARSYLKLALSRWEILKNSYEQASVLAGLADLEMRANDKASAKEYINTGLQRTEDVQDAKMRHYLQDQFQDIIVQLGG